MSKRPTILVVMGALLAALALAVPGHIMFVEGLGPQDFQKIFSQFTLFFVQEAFSA